MMRPDKYVGGGISLRRRPAQRVNDPMVTISEASQKALADATSLKVSLCMKLFATLPAFEDLMKSQGEGRVVLLMQFQNVVTDVIKHFYNNDQKAFLICGNFTQPEVEALQGLLNLTGDLFLAGKLNISALAKCRRFIQYILNKEEVAEWQKTGTIFEQREPFQA